MTASHMCEYVAPGAHVRWGLFMSLRPQKEERCKETYQIRLAIWLWSTLVTSVAEYFHILLRKPWIAVIIVNMKLTAKFFRSKSRKQQHISWFPTTCSLRKHLAMEHDEYGTFTMSFSYTILSDIPSIYTCGRHPGHLPANDIIDMYISFVPADVPLHLLTTQLSP